MEVINSMHARQCTATNKQHNYLLTVLLGNATGKGVVINIDSLKFLMPQNHSCINCSSIVQQKVVKVVFFLLYYEEPHYEG